MHRNCEGIQLVQAAVLNREHDAVLEVAPVLVREPDSQGIQMEDDAKMIYNIIKEHNGSIPFTDKSDKEMIKKYFNMSKNAFKRGVGRLLKEGLIIIEKDSIQIKEE